MQPGERQVLLRLPACRRQYPHPRRPGLPRGLGQQDGLAYARIAQEQQHPAFRIRRGHQFPQPGQFLLPADQARVPHAVIWTHVAEVNWALLGFLRAL